MQQALNKVRVSPNRTKVYVPIVLGKLGCVINLAQSWPPLPAGGKPTLKDLEGRYHIGLVRHVAAVPSGTATVGDDLLSHLFRGVRIQIDNVDRRSAGSQGQGDGPADATGPAGYDGSFAVQPKHITAHCAPPN